MRFLIILMLALGLNCTSTKKMSATSNNLDGTWIPVRQEMNGSEIPVAALKNEKLVIYDTTYEFTAESVDKGVLKYSGNKMDIYGREGINSGKHFTAIYKLENAELTICYNLSGDSYPEAFDTKGKPKNFLSVFKKQ
jgi:uncharacterized protein (TIGR03067 family)